MNLRELAGRRFVGSSVALVAGATLAASFAPLGWWPLAILCPALLIWLWQGASPKRAGVLGFWFNVGTFATGTYWLYIAIAEIGHAPLYLTFFLMAGLVAIMGAYHYLLGWLVAKYLPAAGAWRWIVGIPSLWLLMEWFRSWFLSGFGWLALGYSQTDTWLAGLAPVIGQYGMGYVVLLVAGALVTLLLGTQRERLAAGAVIVVAWGAGFALRGIEWTQPFGRAINVAVIQGAIPQDEKWLAENLQETLDLYARMTKEAHGVDLVVWPESAAPALANDLIPYYEDVYRDASAQGTALLMGTLREENGEYFNSVLSMAPGEKTVGWYDKHHLVPFTEFVPVPGFVREWLRVMNLPYSDFTRGAAHQEPLPAAGQHIAASVCYEDAYGSTQLPALRTATLLVNVTNDAWFGKSAARYQHLQISRLRAREAGRPMIRAANNGVSAVIDARGDLGATAPEYTPTVLRAEIQPRTGLTPYARTGNWAIVSLALVFGLLSAHFRRRAELHSTGPVYSGNTDDIHERVR